MMRLILYYTQIISMVILLLLSCPLFGQGIQQPKLTPANYPDWGNLYLSELSDMGDWVSFKMQYEDGRDTLFVSNTEGTKLYRIPFGHAGTFKDETHFVCLLPSDQGLILDLKKGTREIIKAVNGFELIAPQNMILLKNQDPMGFMHLQLKSLSTHKTVSAAEQVTAYALSPDASKMAIATAHNGIARVRTLHLNTLLWTDVYEESTVSYFFNLIWDQKCGSLLFSKQSKLREVLPSEGIYYYSTQDLALKKLTPASLLALAHRYDLQGFYPTSLAFGQKGNRVYVELSAKHLEQSVNEYVEIWQVTDPELGTKKHKHYNTQLACWHLDTDTLVILGQERKEIVQLHEKAGLLLTCDSAPYKPSFKSESDVDLVLTDLESGASRLFLKAFPRDFSSLHFSPAGGYLTYFSDGNWWVYAIKTQKHVNLTEHIAVDFSSANYSLVNKQNAYGFGGWTADSKHLIVYDAFDCWQLSLTSKKAKRLTHGREKDLVYRLVNAQTTEQRTRPFFMKSAPIVALKQPILVQEKSHDFNTEGFYTLDGGVLKAFIARGAYHLAGLRQSKNKKQVVYTQERYDASPIIVSKTADGKTQTIFESNVQYKNFSWGKSTLIKYKNAQGLDLQGVLFYPFAYDTTKKYPMVVRIYETLAFTQHLFTNPGFGNADGFNKTNYTSQGYFVFFPDIHYEIGNPGFSAVDCVVSGVQEVIKSGFVDNQRIGLIGQSFGGYESFFIATQTDLFSAVVTGAGVSDLTSCYFTFGKSYQKPETWRFEYGQMRMGNSFFENPEGYYSNSPLMHLEKINTPILSWVGSHDSQVDPAQTMNFHMGMRRLQKPHVLLQYHNEGHVIMQPNNQKDLTIRIMEWFDYYLKEGKKPDWLAP